MTNQKFGIKPDVGSKTARQIRCKRLLCVLLLCACVVVVAIQKSSFMPIVESRKCAYSETVENIEVSNFPKNYHGNLAAFNSVSIFLNTGIGQWMDKLSLLSGTNIRFALNNNTIHRCSLILKVEILWAYRVTNTNSNIGFYIVGWSLSRVANIYSKMIPTYFSNLANTVQKNISPHSVNHSSLGNFGLFANMIKSEQRNNGRNNSGNSDNTFYDYFGFAGLFIVFVCFATWCLVFSSYKYWSRFFDGEPIYGLKAFPLFPGSFLLMPIFVHITHRTYFWWQPTEFTPYKDLISAIGIVLFLVLCFWGGYKYYKNIYLPHNGGGVLPKTARKNAPLTRNSDSCFGSARPEG